MFFLLLYRVLGRDMATIENEEKELSSQILTFRGFVQLGRPIINLLLLLNQI